MTDGKTQLVGLIGWPVEHSVSPPMHNAAFKNLGLNWHYVPLPVRPGDVEPALRGLQALGFRGINVTVPHKQAVMPFLDDVTETAQAIGAVNTIVVHPDRLIGHNTDAYGFLADLQNAGFEPTGKHALVMGAGGAARAVVYALAQSECAVTIQNRTPGRAADLADDMLSIGVKSTVAWTLGAPGLIDIELDQFDLLVNATSAGMWPHTEVSPWPERLPLPSRWTVYDLVFNPMETNLLAQARAAGATAVGGLGMLVWQGAAAFEMWTGEGPENKIARLMRPACESALFE